MNRSFAYGLAGLLLAGVAFMVARSRCECEGSLSNPLDEVDRMMSHTRKKLGEIQDSLSEFRQVLTQATLIEPGPKAQTGSA